MSSFERFQRPQGCDVARGMQPPSWGWSGVQAMLPQFVCLQNRQRAGLGKWPCWES